MRKLQQRTAPIADVSYPQELPEVLRALLRARGIADALSFLYPENVPLHDPMLLGGIPEAAQRLIKARENHEKVIIWGDYDVDGVSATALLTRFFAHYGIQSDYYIPSRHEEGYGLNEKAIRALPEDVRILLTVDNGISNKGDVEIAKERGLDVIVTDHHRPGDRVPDCIVIDPLLGDYPYKFLCGTGVAFKLACALDQEFALTLLDIVSVATVADIVPLTGENRTIVARGLRLMNESPRPCYRALLKASGTREGHVTAGDYGFRLGPRMNAAGRLGDAKRALRLLLEDDPARCDEYAAVLEQENSHRKQVENNIWNDAQKQLETYPLASRRIIVLAGDWDSGVIGLAASRIVERYHLPTILLARVGGVLTGSCRSIEGVDIYAALTAVSQHFLRYGGHKQAAGLTMNESELEPFIEDINRFLVETTDPACFIPTTLYDIEAPLSMTLEDVRMLSLMEPTGCENEPPVFMSRATVSISRAVGQDGNTLKLQFEQDATRMDGVWFRHGKEAPIYGGRDVQVIYAPDINVFNGRESVQCMVQDMIPVSDGAIRLNTAHFAAFLTDRLEKEDFPSLRSENASLSLHKWQSLLASDPMGTLLIACDKRTVEDILPHLDKNVPDVYVGTYPTDRRGFNALCLLPVGQFPEGYKRVILLDAPAALFPDIPKDIPLFSDENVPNASWLSLVPSVDEMRTLYQTLRKLLARPYLRKDAMLLYRDIFNACALPLIPTIMGLYVLRHMKLIEFTSKPLSIALLPVIKASPEEDALYQALRSASPKEA